jgi:hypothetical protein
VVSTQEDLLSQMVDGTRIASLIRRALDDPDLWVRLFHCPDKVIAEEGLSPAEATAIRAGDLSRVRLDDDTLAAGRKIFGEQPPTDGISNETAFMTVHSDRVTQLCT